MGERKSKRDPMNGQGIVFTRHPEKFPAWVEKLYYKRDFHR